MEALGVSTTTSELRFHVYQYESVFAAAVQAAADKIAREEEETAFREMSIRWKINSIPAMQAATFQLDPLAALADAWGLTAQMERFFSVGAGKDIFGDSQPIAVDASRKLVAEIRALAESVVGDENVRTVTPRLMQWLDENPIEDISFGRRTVAVDAATITAAEWGVGGLRSVGQIEDLVRDLSDRLTIYGEQLPKLARWHSELLAIEMKLKMVDPLSASLTNIDASIASVDKEMGSLRAFVDATPDLIASERDVLVAALQKELGVALGEIDRQRVETIAALTVERQRVFEDMDSLRAVLLEDVERAHVAATTNLEAVEARQSQLVVAEAQGLMDLMFWRTLILLSVGLVGLAVVLRLSRTPKTS
jgi:hypothetical protein